MKTADWLKRDPHFRRDKAAARPVEELVRDWLCARGNRAEVLVKPVGDDPKDTDAGDIELNGRWVVEVTGYKDLDFCSVAEFPFSRVIVDGCRKLDGRDELPALFFKVNRQRTGALVFHGPDTRGRWVRDRLWDTPKGRHRPFYLISKELTRYYDLRVPWQSWERDGVQAHSRG